MPHHSTNRLIGLCLLFTTLLATTSLAADASDYLSPLKLPTLIDLGATKCIPCKMMAPILDELDTTYQDHFDVQFYDVWQDNTPGKVFGVRLIPTQIFFDEKGNELFRHEGFFAREDILKTWKRLGYAFPELKPTAKD